MNPFDMRGPEFLVVYIGALFALGILSYMLRSIWLAQPSARADDSLLSSLHPYEVAYLEGGAGNAIAAAVAALIHRGRLELTGDKLTLTDAGPERELVAEGVYRGVTKERPDHAIEEAILR